jgi:hypothetical protein
MGPSAPRASVSKGENLFPHRPGKGAAGAGKTHALLPGIRTGSRRKRRPGQLHSTTSPRSEMSVCKVSPARGQKIEQAPAFPAGRRLGHTPQILSGIAKFYAPEDLVGRTVVAAPTSPGKMWARE